RNLTITASDGGRALGLDNMGNRGGDGGSVYAAGGNAGWGGRGGDAGIMRMDLGGALTVTNPGDFAAGIAMPGLGGAGGNGGIANAGYGDSGWGGNGGNGANINLDATQGGSVSVTTKGTDSAGLSMDSRGGRGGDAGGDFSAGGHGGLGGQGGSGL